MKSSLACLFALASLAVASVPSPDHARYFEPSGDHFVSHTHGATVRIDGRGAEYRSGARGFSMRWAGVTGSNPIGQSKLASYSNYLTGPRSEWRTRVPHFSQVRANSLYPGIDAVYYWAGNEFEFDVTVAPGADSRTARLRFDGTKRVRIGHAGELEVETAAGSMTLRKPVAYQMIDGKRHSVEARFRVARNEVGFEVGRYDRSRELIIDPVVYTGYFGGDRADYAAALAIDTFGSVWVAGHTTSTLDVTSAPTIQISPAGKRDNYLTKFVRNAEGGLTLGYYTYYGGAENDQVTAMRLGPNGFVYLTGTTTSTDYPAGGAVLQSAPGGDLDAFVTVLKPEDPFGEYVWFSGFYGGAGRDVPNSIAVDAAGSVYVAGYTSSADLPGVDGRLQGSNRGGWDAFLIQVTTSAPSPLAYATYLGGDGTDVIADIAVAPDQSLYLVGYTGSSDFPVSVASEHARNQIDIFVSRVDVRRGGLDALLFAAYVPASGLDTATRMALDTDGQIWITGYTTSEDFPTTSTAHRNTFAGEADAFLLRVNPGAAPESLVTYGSYLGGSSTDVASAIALGANGQVALAGYTFSLDFPFADSSAAAPVRGADAFVTLLNTNAAGPGALVVSRTLGGSLQDAATGVGFMQGGVLATAGFSTSFDLPSTDGTNKTTQFGLEQSFVFTVTPPAR